MTQVAESPGHSKVTISQRHLSQEGRAVPSVSNSAIETVKGYKKLIVFQKADELVFRVYQVTKLFPKEEIYGLTSQLRRAVVSVTTNIVEGSGRQGKGETKHFLNIALGSLCETEYLIDLSKRLEFLDPETHGELQNLRREVGALLWMFYKSFNQ